MVRCVRLWRGEWKKNGEGEWDFLTDPKDYGYRLLVGKSASYEAVDQIVRRRYSLSPHTPLVISYRLPSWMLVPLGNKMQPTTISNTAQLSKLLNVRTWLEDLALLVTMGAKAVAEYQFLCRTNFTIGATAGREIIELDDDDEEMVDGSPGQLLGGNGGRTPVTRAEAMPVFWDVGMNIAGYPPTCTQPSRGGEGIEDGMLFWEGVANARFGEEGNMNGDVRNENQRSRTTMVEIGNSVSERSSKTWGRP
ncbi:hypothetical protein Bca4012_098958 [Brassica carinata]